MILIDFSQVAFQCVFSFQSEMSFSSISCNIEEKRKNATFVLRNAILTEILKFQKPRWLNEFGKITLCCDGRHYWRKKVFPFYKASRKEKRESLSINWEVVFPIIDSIRDEIKGNFSIPVVKENNSEADDVIAILAKSISEKENPEKVLIVSRDEDYCQLQRYSNVFQWSPVDNVFIWADNCTPIAEKILKGDRGDGIPSVLNPDNIYVDGVRAKALRKNVIEKLLQEGYKNCTDGVLKERWKRNARLIDFRFIPKIIENNILLEYSHAVKISESVSEIDTFNYAVSHGMDWIFKEQ